MVEYDSRLYHCHKIRRNVSIQEDYEVINGKRILVHCYCPVFIYGDGSRKCNGLSDHGIKCGYANYTRSVEENEK